jgi:predicted SnoaL-like aldol condensation-catalyzing enzyme
MSNDPVKLGYLFAEIVSGHDVPRLDEIVAPGYVNHNPFAEPGREGVKKTFGALLAGVPDMKVTVEDVFVSADGSRLVGRYRYEGTHAGNFLGYPATGNPFVMRSIDIWRVEDGRFIEHWDELNTLDIFTQIGALAPLGLPRTHGGPQQSAT